MSIWLKALCMALLGYVLVFSLYTPLVPGGLSVDVNELRPGKNTFTFTGYNTHFKSQVSSLQLLVMSGTTPYCAQIDDVRDESHVTGTIVLPDTLPSSTIGFFVNNDMDGTLSVFKALNISNFTWDTENKKTACDLVVKNNEHSTFGFPFQHKLYEGIRNLMFHVPMWFTMFFLMIMSFVYGIKYMNRSKNRGMSEVGAEAILKLDRKSADYAQVGLVFSSLGLITGSIWARFTWGDWWTNDPQLNGAMVVFLMYAAYFVLRSSTIDPEKRARLSAIYNVFAFVMLVFLLMIMPRFYDSLHPGKGGNPGFNSYDLDSSLRAVFYPAVLGWILLGYWIYTIKNRISSLQWKKEHGE